MKHEQAIYHGKAGDKAAMAAAITRAKQIGGSVVLSWPPEPPLVNEDGMPLLGYYSDPSDCPFIRNGEKLVYPKG